MVCCLSGWVFEWFGVLVVGWLAVGVVGCLSGWVFGWLGVLIVQCLSGCVVKNCVFEW